MRCNCPWHEGGREVVKIRTIFRGGKMIEGCVQCTDGLLTPMYSTTKRLRRNAAGKDFWISPAHVRDIKMRRVAPDLQNVWYDRKGLGAACDIRKSAEFKRSEACWNSGRGARGARSGDRK